MPIDFLPPNSDTLMRYASVPISFTVRSRLRVTPIEGGLGGLVLVQEPVDPPWMKDYDVDEPPITWPNLFDMHNWALIIATANNGRVVGGATVAYDTPGIHMLEGRRDLVVLWDIRVHPEMRGKGVGSLLYRAACDWARSRGDGKTVRQLKAETQNINVDACRFYAAQGAVLGAINSYGYSGTKYADEAMLLWYKDLV